MTELKLLQCRLDGRYDLDVLVSRADGASQPWHRSVELEKADHLTLRVP